MHRCTSVHIGAHGCTWLHMVALVLISGYVWTLLDYIGSYWFIIKPH